MAEERKWYYAKGGQSHGPMSEHELCRQRAAGVFTADDFVYSKGATDGWVKASTVPGLCDSLELDAEPAPEHHEVPLHERAAYNQAGGKQPVKKEAPKAAKK
jgi:hypothetical protein